MKRTLTSSILCLSFLALTGCGGGGCGSTYTGTTSKGDVKPVGVVKIDTDTKGQSVDQAMIKKRLEQIKHGSIKHVYVISPYSGAVLLYSTAKGNVISGGKRLSPYTVDGSPDITMKKNENHNPIVKIGNRRFYTTELPQDVGT